MTAQSSIPLKWYVPFANGDAGRTELPVTTADPTRASQTLGFPPLTMQPPESGGVPPQAEDFNGGMNQVARITWWTLNGGGWPFDSTFATNSNINGYPNGALLQSADFRGYWLNTSDNNQINPDTVGTGWVPGFQYGTTAIVGLTNANVTLSPAQAAKDGITLAGTLTGNVQIIVPTWLKTWSVTNNTTGAFAITFKTPSGSGVIIPQNGAPTTVIGDGTNITQPARNIATATTGTNGATLFQVGLRNEQAYSSSSTFTVPAATNRIKVRVWGGGGGGGGTNGASAAASGGNAGGYSEGFFTVTPGAVLTVTVGLGGTAGPAGSNGGTGGTSSVTGCNQATGGGGGTGINAGAAAANTTTFGTGSGGQINLTGAGASGAYNFGGAFVGSAGQGAFGSAPTPVALSNAGFPGVLPGGAGSGASQGASSIGGVGATGFVIIEW